MRKTVLQTCLLLPFALSAQAGSFVDQRGRTLTFDAPVARVVTIAIPQFWIFMAVDAGASKLVGAHPTALAQIRAGILPKIFPAALSVPSDIVRGGFVPNVEELLRLKPDVVFQWADRGDELVTTLDAVGLKTVGVKNTATEADFPLWARMMGETAGRQTRVEQMLAERARAIEAIASATTAVPEAEKPRVLSLQQYSKMLVAEGVNSYTDLFIRRAGGRNVTSDSPGGPAGNINVNVEQVLSWKPDMILLSQFEEKAPSDFYADPLWRSLPAVVNRRVYKLPFGGSRWGGSDQETSLFLIWLTELQNPGRLSTNLVAEMRSLYRFLYAYDLSNPDIERILQTPQNAGSSHYDQFAAQ